jgi:TIR domain
VAHDVFISHSSSDKTVANAVCAKLENAAIRCWIAPRDVQPGRSFAGEITRAIQQSKVMVMIFSAHSNNSDQVLREVQLAVNAHLHIIQFRIEDVHLNDDLRYFLSTPHWLDALTPPLEAHLERLKNSIKALLAEAGEAAASESQPTRPPIKAMPLPPTAPPPPPAPPVSTWWQPPKIFVPIAALVFVLIAATWWISHSKPKATSGAAPREAKKEVVDLPVAGTQITTPLAVSPTPSAPPVVPVQQTPAIAMKEQVAAQPTAAPTATPQNVVLTKEMASTFAEQTVNAMSAGDVDSLVSLYNERVDYLDEGNVDQKRIRKDLEQYFNRWPKTSWQMSGPLSTQPLGQNQYRLSFPVSFVATNPAANKQAAGSARETMIVAQDSTGAWKIVSRRETIVRSDRTRPPVATTPIRGQRVDTPPEPDKSRQNMEEIARRLQTLFPH